MHLGAVFGLDNRRRAGEAFFDVALRPSVVVASIGSADVAFLRNVACATSASRGGLFGSRAGKHQRSIGLARFGALHYERLRLILHLHQPRGFQRAGRSGRGHGRDRLPGVAHDGIAGGNFLRLVLEFRLP